MTKFWKAIVQTALVVSVVLGLAALLAMPVSAAGGAELLAEHPGAEATIDEADVKPVLEKPGPFLLGDQPWAYLNGVKAGQKLQHPNLPHGGNQWTGTMKVTLDGNPEVYEVYCTQLYVNWCNKSWHGPDPNVDIPEVIWILNNYYPAVPGEPASMSSNAKKAAAVQLAIWHFTDGLDITWPCAAGETCAQGSPADIFDAARAIIAAAKGNTAGWPEVPRVPATLEVEPTVDLSGDPPSRSVGATHTVTATVRDQNGDPIQGVTVEFGVFGSNYGVPDASLLTDALGVATFTYTGLYVGGDVINVRVVYEVPTGLRWANYAKTRDCQKLIMGETTTGELSAGTVVRWEDASREFKLTVFGCLPEDVQFTAYLLKGDEEWQVSLVGPGDDGTYSATIMGIVPGEGYTWEIRFRFQIVLVEWEWR